MRPVAVLDWDVPAAARAFDMPTVSLMACLCNGALAAKLVEYRLAWEWNATVVGGQKAWDLVVDGKRMEVRAITDNGCFFCPSGMVGRGREMSRCGFLHKLRQVAGYVLVDLESMPNTPVFILPSRTVRRWYGNGTLGKGAAMARRKLRRLLANEPEVAR